MKTCLCLYNEIINYKLHFIFSDLLYHLAFTVLYRVLCLNIDFGLISRLADSFAVSPYADFIRMISTGCVIYSLDNDVHSPFKKCLCGEQRKNHKSSLYLVPAQVDSMLSVKDCQILLNKTDIIAAYGSNQHSGEAMVTGDENLNKFGTAYGQVIGVAFDSGKVIKGAVKSGKFPGAVTQAPVAVGAALVQSLDDVSNGKT
jgi:hypothetical protein